MDASWLRKNFLVIVAIIISIVALAVAWPRENIKATSLAIRDETGKNFVYFDAARGIFEIYGPDGQKSAVRIHATEGGTNFIVYGRDGFERIRLSSWTDNGEGYITILRDGWQNRKDDSVVIHIPKDGIKVSKE